MARLAAIVSESALKNAPVTPREKRQRREDDDRRGGRAGQRPRELAPPRASNAARGNVRPARFRMRRMMCSTITMASSMIRPTAAAMPPSVMMLKLMSRTDSSSTVDRQHHGHGDRRDQRDFRRLRRNSQQHDGGEHHADRIRHRATLAAEETINWLWSYQLAMWIPAGSLL